MNISRGKFNFYNRGQSLIGIIIVLVVVGLISGGLYYYFSKQIPEIPEITKKPAEEVVKPGEEITPPPEEELPKEEVAPKGIPLEEKIEEKPIIQKCADGTPDMQCSITKPLYCQNLKLVNACMTCGCSEGMICQQDNTCAEIDLGKKVYILQSGNPKEKLDILFIPANISNFSLLESRIEEIFYRTGKDINGEPIVSFFSVEPFKNYKSKFNVGYINKNINENLFDCYKESTDPTGPPKLHYYYLCNDNKIKEAYKIFDPDYIAVIFEYSGYTSSSGEIQYLNIHLGDDQRFGTLGWTFVHEFGHQFGGLADEYVTTGSPSRHCGTAVDFTCFENYEKALEYYPNLDTIGCPKWCQSYDLNKDSILMRENEECGKIKNQEECKASLGGPSCTWFNLKHPFFNTPCVSTQGVSNIGLNCQGGALCVFGGDYGQLAFNPGGSIMGGGREFNWPSKNHLESILKCCYPRQETDFCKNFRDKFKNLPNSLYPALKKAYEKIISCP